ncbi:MAG: MFS transporter, partial [Anaerovoracaceae bacterium]
NVICYITITLGCFVIMALATMFSVQMIATVQKETPSHLIGKVIALMMSLAMCAQPIGQAIYGVVFDILANNTGYILITVAVIASLISLSSKRAFRKFDN